MFRRKTSQLLFPSTQHITTPGASLSQPAALHYAPQSQLAQLRQRYQHPDLAIDKDGNTVLHHLASRQAAPEKIRQLEQEMGGTALAAMSLIVNHEGKLPIDYTTKSDPSRQYYFDTMCNYKVAKLSAPVYSSKMLGLHSPIDARLKNNVITACQFSNNIRNTIRKSCTHTQANGYSLEKLKVVFNVISENRARLDKYEFAEDDFYEKTAELALHSGHGDCQAFAAAAWLKCMEYAHSNIFLVKGGDHLVAVFDLNEDGSFHPASLIVDPFLGYVCPPDKMDEHLVAYRQLNRYSQPQHAVDTVNFFTSFSRHSHDFVPVIPNELIKQRRKANELVSEQGLFAKKKTVSAPTDLIPTFSSSPHIRR